MRLIDADALKEHKFTTQAANGVEIYNREVVLVASIDNAPTVELDESIIQEVLNKRCMTVVTNQYLIALHGNGRPKGEWIDTGSGQECNVCHEIQYGYDNFRHFCPNCGAEMKKGEDNHPFITLVNCPSCGNCTWRYENNKIVCAICNKWI